MGRGDYSITKSIVNVFGSDVFSKFVFGLTGILLIRYLPPLEYATFILALSVVDVAVRVTSRPLNKIYIVGHAELRFDVSFVSLLGIQLVSVAVLSFVFLPLGLMMGEIYYLIILIIIAGSLFEYVKTIFQWELKFARFAIVNAVLSLVMFSFILGLALVYQEGLRAWQVLLVYMLARAGISLLAFGARFDVTKLFRLGVARQLFHLLSRSRYSFLFGYIVFLAIVSQLNFFMLRGLSSEFELASYGSASRYYDLLMISLAAVNVVLLPHVQRAVKRQELDDIYSKHRKLTFLFAFAVFIGAWASQWIIPMVDMGRYPDAVLIFRVLSISAIVSFAFSPHVHVVFRYKKFKFLFLLATFALVLNCCVNLLLLPIWGAIGAATSYLLVYAVINISTYLRAIGLRKTLLPGVQES